MPLTIHSIPSNDYLQGKIASHRLFYQPKLVELEQTASYPLGEDTFQLDHGTDYFAFFDRLGQASYYVVLDEEKAIAVGAAVLRYVPDGCGDKPRPVWYLCDLKVHPDYRRQHLSLQLFRHAFAQHFAECDRGYAISMNPGDGSPNRVVQLLRFVCPVEFRCTATLEIYSLDAASMQRIEPLLHHYRGAISYLSLKGIKDLRLQSTGTLLPLLHVQFGETAQHPLSHLSHCSPIPGYAHMFCAPRGDTLAIALSQQGIVPQATASIVSHGIDNSDWQFVLTSDI
ncbi:MAG: GNAT family N-acetyltransferase [Oculatellaceae cyanobacterium bins.114]|nr:GNAT family N-acetyltransferase [Oculatellaceae cyanobacterium bins.114]